MVISDFCDAHWQSEPHGEEPRKPDANGKLLVFAPDGTCSFCEQPATHTAGPEGSSSHEREPIPRGHLPDGQR